jgi:hypothetical protein
MLEELNQVTSDLARGVVHVGIGAGLVPVVGLDNGDDLGGVNLDRRRANAVLNSGDVVRCAVGRNVGESDIVETLEGGDRGVDLDDDLSGTIVSLSSPLCWKGLAVTYLVGHLDQLGSGTNGGTGDEAAILENVGSLNDSNIEVAVGTVLGVEALCRDVSRNRSLIGAAKLGGRLKRGRSVKWWGRKRINSSRT